MAPKFSIRRDDTVEVTVGEFEGARGRVLMVLPREGRVVVEGLNLAWKHVRPSQQHPRGGRIEIEAPIDISNVLPVCPNSDCKRFNRGVRVRRRRLEDGARVHTCARCGAQIRPAG